MFKDFTISQTPERGVLLLGSLAFVISFIVAIVVAVFVNVKQKLTLNNMKVGIVGSGYVGLVAAACFAEMGNNVVCVDIDDEKINKLKQGEIPIYEPGLSDLVIENQKKNNLTFTTNIIDALVVSEVIFIAVGTPMGDDGSADLKYVLQVAEAIGKNMTKHLVVVDKSTVPIGTADLVTQTIQKALDLRNLT